jgi:hypothetical protein
MPAKGQLAPNVSHAESIRTFRPSHLKGSHRPLPAFLDTIRRPKNPVKVSLHQSPKRPVDNTTAGAVLLEQLLSDLVYGVPTLGLALRFSPKARHKKGGGSRLSRYVVRFSGAGKRKLQRQFGRSLSFVCRTLFEIIFFTRSCNGRPGYRRRRRLIRT